MPFNKNRNFLNNWKLILAIFIFIGLALTSYFTLKKLNKPTHLALASTFTVNVTSDAVDANAGDGICATAGAVCTLRAAIEEANALAGQDTISFNIPKTDTGCNDPDGGGAGACNNGSNDDTGDEYWSIQPASALPSITGDDGLIMDGYSQPGASANTVETGGLDTVLKIEIDGTNIATNGVIYVNGAKNTTIKGLAINRGYHGVYFYQASAGTNQSVQGCFIGTDITGTVDLGNSQAGIYVRTLSAIVGTNGDGVDDVAERNLISGNDVDGIRTSERDGLIIAGNIIGLDKTGTVALGNTSQGIDIYRTANTRIGTNGDNVSDLIERNIVSSNSSYGIDVDFNKSGCLNLVIAGNYVGTDVTGTLARGNNTYGIVLAGRDALDQNIVIGVNGDGSAGEANEGNVISGNSGEGLFLGSTDGLTIAGNIIGLNYSGTSALGNTAKGMYVFTDLSNLIIGTNSDGISDSLERNIISGNGTDGIMFYNNAFEGRTIAGNYFGTDITGLIAIGNQNRGLYIASPVGGSSELIIGSNLDGVRDDIEGNVISGNLDSGLEFSSNSVSGFKISGNKIGVGSDGVTVLGNTVHGIYFDGRISDSLVGSTDYNANGINIIANNGADGISFHSTDTSSNRGVRVSYNSIYNNTDLGIDLRSNGITANDVGDVDVDGANQLLNFPVITYTDQHVISGTLDINTNETTAKVELYLATEGSGGNGEGQTYLGNTTPTDNDPGTWSISGLTLSDGQYITALTIDADGSTSEFSDNFPVTELRYTVSGSVFEDVNYETNLDGNGYTKAGTAYQDGIDTPIQDARVELYTSESVFTDSVNTAVDGTYTFTDVRNGTYKVRVVSATIDPSSLEGGSYTVDDILAEQTYEHNGSIGNGAMGAMGGNSITVSDSDTANTAGPGDTNLEITVNDGNVTGLEMGFSYNVVTNTGDSGQGTLRQAIINNDVAGADVIVFNIPKTDAACMDPDGGGVGACNDSSNDATGDEYWSITPTTDLPSFVSPSSVTINGYTQSPASVNTNNSGAFNTKIAIEIVGTNDSANGVLYSEDASTLLLKGLAINRGQVHGIHLANDSSTGNIVQGCFIGTDVTGLIDYGNTENGIYLIDLDTTLIGTNGDGTTDVAERNLISGNTLNGILIEGSANNTVIAGNLIGTDITGTLSLGNSDIGIKSYGTNEDQGLVIGINSDGSAGEAYEGNLISGNEDGGISIRGTDDVTIAGNIVGLNISGVGVLSNNNHGIYIYDATSVSIYNVVIGTNADGVSDDLERNIISGNLYNGVRVADVHGYVMKISGNYIGTDITGLVDLGNSQNAIDISLGSTASAVDFVIGSNLDGVRDNIEGNVLSGNSYNGININQPGADFSGFKISGNKIGVGADGVTVLGNSKSGISLLDFDLLNTVTDVLIGSTDYNINGVNIIANNGEDGVNLFSLGFSDFSERMRISYNSIYNNADLGIDLGNSGIKINDVGDVDIWGGNRGLNYPVITSASQNIVSGILDIDTDETTAKVELYLAIEGAGETDEGQTYLGNVTPTDNDFGTWIISDLSLSNGQYVTAIAIDASGNTSEFSFAKIVNNAPTQETPEFESEFNTNYITEDLTAEVQTLADADSDTPLVSSVFWKEGDVSVMNLAMPFDINNEGLTKDITGVRDFSGYGNHGQRGSGLVNAAPTSVAGIKGLAYSFDGGDQITVVDNNSLDLTENYTIETWVNPTSYVGSLNTIIEKQSDKYGLYINDSGKAVFKDHNGSLVGTTTLNTDTWYQVVGVHTGSAKDIYVNGIKENTESATVGTAGTGSLIIGGAAGETAFNGKIDEVYLYGIVLTEEQIEENYNEGTPHHTVIKSNMLSESDTWEVSSVVSDGKDYSTVLTSVSLLISVESTGANALPSILNPYVVPNPPLFKGVKSIFSTRIIWEIKDTILNELGFRLKDSETGENKVSAGKDQTEFIEDGLTPNTKYTRYVTSYNKAGESRAGEEQEEYTLSLVPELITTITENNAVEVSIKGLTEFSADHIGVGDLTAYKYINDTTETESDWVKEVKYNFTDLEEGNYIFRVKTRNAKGVETEWSNSIEIALNNPLLVLEILAESYEGEFGTDNEIASELIGLTSSKKIEQVKTTPISISKYKILYKDDFLENKSEWNRLSGYWIEENEKDSWVNGGVLELDNCTRGICILESAGTLKDYIQEYKLLIPELYEIKNEISVPLRIVSKTSFYEILINSNGTTGVYKRISNWKHEKLGETSLDKIEHGKEYKIKTRIEGNKISYKIWKVGETEPLNWDLAVEDKGILSKVIETGKAGIGSYNKGLRMDNLKIYTKVEKTNNEGSIGLVEISENEKVNIDGSLILGKIEKESSLVVLKILSILLQVMLICFFVITIMLLFQIKELKKYEKTKGFIKCLNKILKGKVEKSKKTLLKPYLQSILLITVISIIIVLGYDVVSFKSKSSSKVLTYASEKQLQSDAEITKGSRIKYTINYANNGEIVANNIILKNVMPGNGYQTGSLFIDGEFSEKENELVKEESGKNVLEISKLVLDPGENHTISYVYKFDEEDVLGKKINAVSIDSTETDLLEKTFGLNLVVLGVIEEVEKIEEEIPEQVTEPNIVVPEEPVVKRNNPNVIPQKPEVEEVVPEKEEVVAEVEEVVEEILVPAKEEEEVIVPAKIFVNGIVEETENEESVSITGESLPEAEIVVYIDDKEFLTKTDKSGNWKLELLYSELSENTTNKKVSYSVKAIARVKQVVNDVLEEITDLELMETEASFIGNISIKDNYNSNNKKVLSTTTITEIVRELEEFIKEKEEPIRVVLATTVPSVVLIDPVLILNLPLLKVYLLHLLMSLLSLLGIKKKNKSWGVVYNAINKEPLSLAVVRLFEIKSKTRKLVETSVTDSNGRYYFIPRSGEYEIEVVKAEYSYPTKIIKGTMDGTYSNIYKKNVFKIREGNVAELNYSIPVDPKNYKGEAKNSVYKTLKYILIKYSKFLSNIIFSLGFLSSLMLYLLSSNKSNAIMLLIYGIVLCTKILLTPKKEKSWGIVFDSMKLERISLASISLVRMEDGKLLKRRLTDYEGRYGFLPPKGSYVLVVEKEGYSYPSKTKKLPRKYKNPYYATEIKFAKNNGIISADIPLDKE